jgi:hypothetical protein
VPVACGWRSGGRADLARRLVSHATRDLDAMCRDTRRWQTQYPDGYKKTNDRA